MALAIDASTPAAVTLTLTQAANTTYTATTASFTPPSGAVLMIAFHTNSASASNTLSVFAVTDNLGSHLTYTQVSQLGNLSNDVQVTLWRAAVASSAPMTVSASYKDSQSETGTPIMLRVLVVTGANTSAPIGAHGGGRGRTTNISGATAQYISTVAGSWGWMEYADWTQSGVPTVPAGETVDASFNAAGQDTFALIKQTATTVAAGTTVTMATSTPASGVQLSFAYFEIVPPAASIPSVGSWLYADCFIRDSIGVIGY